MKRLLQLSLFVGLLFFLRVPSAHATTINAASCSAADVQAAVNLATDGDTVTVPAGDCTYSGGTDAISYIKCITLQGAGATLSGTVLRDNLTTGARIISGTCTTADRSARITGFYFTDGGHILDAQYYGLRISGINNNNSSWRVDHNVFDHIKRGHTLQAQTIVGTYDNNTCYSTFSRHCLTIFDSNWDGISPNGFGDQSWNSSLTFGSSQFLFIETNNFIWDVGAHGGAIDGWSGTRVVFRKNTCLRCQVANHGSESSGRQRSARAYEIYGNIFDTDDELDQIFNMRGGTALMHSNTIVGTMISNASKVDNMRAINYFSTWGSVDGRNAADVNDSNNPYYICSLCVTTSTSTTVTVTGTPWSTNAYAPVTSAGGYIYAVHKVNCVDSSSITNCYAPISSNTTSTITYIQDLFTPTRTLVFTAADSLEINRVYQTLDQPGRSGGGLLSSNNPVIYPSGWNNQTTSPMYEWLNLHGVAYDIHWGLGPTTASTVRLNEHAYNYTTSFDGTVGTGSGSLAARPATCTTGVLYWADDQGEWDSTHMGNDGRAYKCTATNTWTLFYTPYPYPHPLTQTDSSGPTISMTAPADMATVSGSAVTISATAADDIAVIGVQFKLDGFNFGSEDTSSPYSLTWNTLTSSNGSHTITAVARDASGNSTTAMSITVTVDNNVVVDANKILFSIQPPLVIKLGTYFSVTVYVVTSMDVPVTSATNSITLLQSANCKSNLNGTTVRNATAGVAAFPSLRFLSRPSSPDFCTINATATGLVTGTSTNVRTVK